jgi:RHS repeat-associated protein
LAVFLLLAVSAYPAIAAPGGASPSQAPGGPPAGAPAGHPPPGPPASPGPTAQEQGTPPQDPASVGERQRSQHAYQGLDRAHAEQVMHDKFSKQMAALDTEPGRWLAPNDFKHFSSDRVALVDPPGGQGPALLESIAPLATQSPDGKLSPVDLSLTQQDGNFVPKNPLTGVTLPGDAGSEIRLSQSKVGIRLAGTGSNPSQASEIDGNKLFYPNVAPDTDLLLAPITQGVELFEQIRSAAAPEQLSFHVDLPAGASLRTTSMGLEAVQNDERIALITSPSATDAQGTPVETKLEVTGPDSFDLVVSHQQSDRAYPILVDPGIYDGFGNWSASTPPPGWFTVGWQPSGANFAEGVSGGPSLWAQAGQAYASGTWKEWYYTVPGTTSYIADASLHLGYISSGSSEPHGFVGLWSGSAWTSGPLFFYADSGGPFSWDFNPGTAATATRSVVMGMQNSGGSGVLQTNKQLFIDGASILVDDPEAPSLSVSSTPGWVKNLSFSASDPGLGIQDVDAQDANTSSKDSTVHEDHLGDWSPNPPCDGLADAPCPSSNGGQAMTNLPEGDNNITLKAQDPTGKVTTSSPIEAKIDRSPPTLDLSGDLADAPKTDLTSTLSGPDLGSRTYGLDVLARDGSASGPSAEQSGVTDVKFTLWSSSDGTNWTQQSQYTADHPQACTVPAGSCDESAHYDVNASTLTPGTYYKLRVTATDAVGNTDAAGNPTTKEIPFKVTGRIGVLTSPKTGDTSARRFTLTSEAHDPSYNAVKYYYGTQSGGTWSYTAIDPQYLSYSSGTNAGSQPTKAIPLDAPTQQAPTVRQAPAVVWDVASTPGVPKPGQFRVRATFLKSQDVLIKNDAPSLYWRLGESSGTTAADSSTGNHPGTYVGSPSLHQMPGAFGGQFWDDGAVGLNGSSQYISSSYSPFVNGTNRTFEGWAKRTSSSAQDALIGTVGLLNAPFLALGSNSNNVIWAPGGNTGQQKTWSNAWPGNNVWVHWALVYKQASGTVELFINGVSQGGPQPLTQSYGASGPLYAGADGQLNSPGDFFHGSMDEIAVYESALSSTQIQSHDSPPEYPSQDATVNFDPDTTTSKHASTSVGPGTLDLLTGNYALTSDDVTIKNFDSGMTVSRIFNSRQPTGGLGPSTSPGKYSPLGPGWIPSVPIDAAGSDFVKLNEVGPQGDAASVIKVTESDTTNITFTRINGDYVAEPLYRDLSLTQTSGGYAIKDLDGNVTSFVKVDQNSPDYLPFKVQQPGTSKDETTSTFQYETVNTGDPNQPTVTRIVTAIAPAPPDANCTGDPSFPGTPAGCRGLAFVYSDASTQAPTPGNYGDYPYRLKEIIFQNGQNIINMNQRGQAPPPNPNIVAQYEYDSNGRLHSEWDPRLSQSTDCSLSGGACGSDLKTTYSYESHGLVSSVTPPGENAWNFTYASTPADTAPFPERLSTVSRPVPGGGTATSTVTYNVPLSGSGAPYDMSPSSVARWGQSDLPTDATAVVPPGVSASDYGKGVVTYMNRNGDPVNVANPGGAITTTEYQQDRQVSRTLSAQDRATALAYSSDPAQQAAESRLLDTQNTYAAHGLELTDQLGPQHQVQVNTGGPLVDARQHTVTAYDQNAPSGGPYYLPTRVTETALRADIHTDVDPRVSTTQYDWLLRLPTVQTVDPAGLNLQTITHYDDRTGLVSDTQTPKGNGTATTTGTDAHTTKMVYYTAGANATVSSCGNKPDWNGLLCMQGPAAQPTTGNAGPLPTTTYQYNQWLEPTTTTESVSGAPDRVTQTTYDTASRPYQTSVSGGVGTAVPTITNLYDPNTGRNVVTGDGTRGIVHQYDASGRLIAYTDGSGVQSNFTYDPRDRLTGMNDGVRGYQNYGYDATTGQLTSMLDGQLGMFYATYNADGQLVTESMPNGLLLQNIYDSTGTPLSRTYTRGSAQVMQFTEARSIHGQVTNETTWANGAQTGMNNEVYDSAGRLIQSQDSTLPTGGCAVDNYKYDQNSNRTEQRTVAPSPSTPCDTNPLDGSLVGHSYDEADRLLSTSQSNNSSNYTYDAFGRTTTVPAVDAGGQALTNLGYYVDDRVQAMTQNGVTKSFAYDPAGRVRVTTTTGQPDQIDHFSSDSDSPSWSEQAGTANWQRYVPDIAGSLCAVQQGSGSSSGTLTYELTNLEGSVAGEANSAGQLNQQFKASEFGVPQGPQPSSGYGWLGGKERKAQFASGITTMGQRVYVPELGRFLQTDPVSGGSANAYDYVNQDPLNQSDPAGTRSRRRQAQASVCELSDTGLSEEGTTFGQQTIISGTAHFSCYGTVTHMHLHAEIQREVRPHVWKNVGSPFTRAQGSDVGVGPCFATPLGCTLSVTVQATCSSALNPHSYRIHFVGKAKYQGLPPPKLDFPADALTADLNCRGSPV